MRRSAGISDQSHLGGTVAKEVEDEKGRRESARLFLDREAVSADGPLRGIAERSAVEMNAEPREGERRTRIRGRGRAIMALPMPQEQGLVEARGREEAAVLGRQTDPGSVPQVPGRDRARSGPGPQPAS